MINHFIKTFSLKDTFIFLLLLLSTFSIGHKTIELYIFNNLFLFFAGFYYKSINVKGLYCIIVFYIFLFIKVICFDQVEIFDSFFFSQINHFFQLPILIYLWYEIIKRKCVKFINFLKGNYIFVYIVLICSILTHIYLYGKSFNDFILFYVVILFSFYINFKKKDVLFFILFLITPILFNFERLTFAIILFFIFLDRIFINQYWRLYFYRFFIILVPLSSICIILFSSNNIISYINNFDGNFALRMEMIRLAYELFTSNIIHFIFGVPFGEYYRFPDYTSAVYVNHLWDPYMLKTVPNHNSIFDIFFRFGFFGLFFIVFFIKKIIFSSYACKPVQNNITFLFFLFIFGISINPYLEDQDNLLFISFIISSILFLHNRYILQK